MARLLLGILTAVFLVLWVVNWWIFTPALSERAVEQAEARAVLARRVVALSAQARRAEIDAALFRAAANPNLVRALEPSRGRPEAPSDELLAQVRALVSDAVPPELRQGLVVGLVSGGGSRLARDGAIVPADAIELPNLAQAGSDGSVREAFGSPHAFHSVHVGASDLVVGVPLVPESLLEGLISEGANAGGVAALGVARDGQIIQAAGSAKGLLKTALASSARGAEVIERGPAARFGPFKLPSFTSSDVLGGAAPLAVASRQSLFPAQYEVVAVVSVAPAMRVIAAPQKFAIVVFFAIGALGAVAWVLVNGSRKSTRNAAESLEAFAEGEQASPAPAQAPEQPPRPEVEAAGASAEEPASPPQDRAGDGAALFSGSSDEYLPPSSGEQEPPPGEPPPQDGSAMGDLHPFGAALFGTAHSPPVEDPADAKTIAADPSSAPHANGAGEPYPASAPPDIQGAAPVNADEEHFQDVFQNFLAIRQQCGESAEGLTYEKFAQKLEKNRDQLVARYQCRTVRFQVYVKEGRAALKATPIKD